MIPAELDLTQYSEGLRQVIDSHVKTDSTPELDRHLLQRIKCGMDLGLAVLEDTWGKLPDEIKTADYLFQQLMIFLTATLEVGHIMREMNTQPAPGKEEEFSKDFEDTTRNYVINGKLFKHVEKTVDLLTNYIAPFTLWWIETEYVETVIDPEIKIFDKTYDLPEETEE